MHPFYDANRSLMSSRDTRLLGLASMAAYLAFWAAAIPFVLRAMSRALARSAAGSGTPAAIPPPDATRPSPDRAEAIVRERYAAGEIDDDELRSRLHVLRSDSIQHGRAPNQPAQH